MHQLACPREGAERMVFESERDDAFIRDDKARNAYFGGALLQFVVLERANRCLGLAIGQKMLHRKAGKLPD